MKSVQSVLTIALKIAPQNAPQIVQNFAKKLPLKLLQTLPPILLFDWPINVPQNFPLQPQK